MKQKTVAKQVKDYVKISVNLPEDLHKRLVDVVDTLGADKTGLIVRALDEKMPDFEREAEAVQRVRAQSAAPRQPSKKK